MDGAAGPQPFASVPLNSAQVRGLTRANLNTGRFQPAVPTRQKSTPAEIKSHGPQVFRSLFIGARVRFGVLVAQPGGIRRGGGRGLGPHRPFWLSRNQTGALHVFRRASHAGLSILIGLIGAAAIWQSGARGVSRILLAFLIDAVLLAYPAYLGLQYRRLPAIHDITTDPIDPPRFEALARLRSGDGANPAVYAGLYSAEQQRIAYPDIETVELEVPVQRAYEITLQLVTKRKWLVIDERPPQPPRRIGRIEAVARSPIMGFREDVSIRVTPDDEDSRVDIRSASRYFESDLGSNAARIRKLMEDLNNAADNESLKPAKKPVAPVKASPKVVKK